MSGKIVEDKLFFFTNYEGVRQTRGLFFDNFVPSARFRTKFTAALAPALAVLPLPNAPKIFTNSPTVPVSNAGFFEYGEYQATRNGTLREDTGSVKIDYNYSETVSFRCDTTSMIRTRLTPYGVGTDQIADGTLRVQLFKLSNNYAIFGDTRQRICFRHQPQRNQCRRGIFQPFPNCQFSVRRSALRSTVSVRRSLTSIERERFTNFSTRFSSVHGNHSMKAGLDIRLNRRDAESKTQETLSYLDLFRADTLDLKNNLPFIVSKGGNPLLSYANENFSLFFQDDWKAHPRLTLNLGLRYDVSTSAAKKTGLLQNFDPGDAKFSPLGDENLQRR